MTLTSPIAYNKTTLFLLPLVDGLHIKHRVVPKLINAYLGKNDQEIGKYIYLLFSDLSLAEEKELSNVHNFISCQTLENNFTLFKYGLEKEIKETVIDPFLEGKYSEIDRDFLNKSHQLWVYDFRKRRFIKNEIYQICIKDKFYKEYLEKILDVTIDTDAELGTIPNCEEELFSHSIFTQYVTTKKASEMEANSCEVDSLHEESVFGRLYPGSRQILESALKTNS
jgi:hypothetical protein